MREPLRSTAQQAVADDTNRRDEAGGDQVARSMYRAAWWVGIMGAEEMTGDGQMLG